MQNNAGRTQKKRGARSNNASSKVSCRSAILSEDTTTVEFPCQFLALVTMAQSAIKRATFARTATKRAYLLNGSNCLRSKWKR